MDPLQLTILTARLDSVKDSQKRARAALIIVAFSVSIVLMALWNAYLGWDSVFAKEPLLSDGQGSEVNSGRNETRKASIKTWVDSQIISIPLLGIKVSASDAAVIGALVLFILNYYYCLCLRRENRDIANFLIDTKDGSKDVRRYIFTAIQAGMVFNIGTDDVPIGRLSDGNQNRHQIKVPMRTLLWIFIYAPFLTVLLIVGSDVYAAFGPYDSPFRAPSVAGHLWHNLKELQIQLIWTDVFALITAVFMFLICRKIHKYHNATFQILSEYGDL